MHVLTHIAGIVFGAICAGGTWLMGGPMIAVLPIFAITGHGLILFLDYSIEANRDQASGTDHIWLAPYHPIDVIQGNEWPEAA